MTRTVRALEITCWVAGAAMLGLYFGASFALEAQRERGIEAFIQAREPGPANYPNFVTPESFAWPDFPPPEAASSSPVSYSLAASDELPIALLSIASVGLEVPVFAGTSERNLSRGAGWVEGTAAPDDGGNMAIAAHRDGYFRALKDLALGDVLILESIDHTRNYRVTEISVVDPGDTSSLFATDTPAVTLVTCYPFYFVGPAPQRYIVRAVVDQ